MEGNRIGHEVLALARSATTTDRERAFAEFAERMLPRHYRLAAVILGDPAEAEDATHDAFEAAWRRWHTLRDPHRVDAWFGRILVNVCRDRLRHRKRHPVTELGDALAGSIAARDDLSVTADRDEVGRALAGLNPDQRVVIVLRYYADLPVDAIAERVGVPAGTVKSRIHHALAAMHQAIVAGRHTGRTR